jgi:hypothetical protein
MGQVVPTIFKGGTEVLVIESDALTLRAGVCGTDARGEFHVTGYGTSSATDLGAALADVVRDLSRGGRLPAQTIFLSPQVQTTILHLPVDPRSPLPFQNMQELVKWELEPYLAQNRARRIGAILAGRGYVSWTDLERLLTEAEQSARGPVQGGPARRLGELAIQAGLVTEAQLAECLALQQSTQDFAGDAVCGWTPLDDQPQDGKWRWLVSGMPRAYREHVVKAFKSAGLRLIAIYPLVGCAGASLNGDAGRASVVFEYDGGYLSYTRFRDRKVVSSRSQFTHEAGNPVRSCVDLFEGEAEHVWLAGRWPDMPAAACDLEARLKIPCAAIPLKMVALPPGLEETAVVTGMKGAVSHYLDHAASGVACVAATEPAPPLLGHWWVRVALAAGLLTALLVGATVWLHGQRLATSAALQDQQVLAAARRGATALRQRLGELDKSVAFLQETLPRRQQLIPGLFAALEASCPEEITIGRLEERGKGDILLTGWGASTQDIQAFKINLQNSLAGLKVADGEKPIRQESHGRSSSGYTFELRLLPDEPLPERKK